MAPVPSGQGRTAGPKVSSTLPSKQGLGTPRGPSRRPSWASASSCSRLLRPGRSCPLSRQPPCTTTEHILPITLVQALGPAQEYNGGKATGHECGKPPLTEVTYCALSTAETPPLLPPKLVPRTLSCIHSCDLLGVTGSGELSESAHFANEKRRH